MLTIVAAGFLALDGILLALAGSWARSLNLIVWGVIFMGGALGVVVYWRHHNRRLAQLREALEIEAMKLNTFHADVEGSGES